MQKVQDQMYHQYFGLSEAPFSIAVNPRYLFMSARHRDALAHLLYGVGAGGGFILLTGEVGTGKTTINRALLEQMPQDTDIAIILNPALNALELLATACDELNIDYDRDNPTLKTLTDKLHAFLLSNHSEGRNTVLMIDEAQHLDFDVLEQIRLLTNLETNTKKLLQIILIGQPELVELLNRPELRQLNQRITARYNLDPLNREETSAYIRHRLQVAGLPPGRELFPPAVVRGIFKRTRGIPRLINVLCDRILLGAYGRNRQRADMATLRVAAREVMGEESSPPQRVNKGLLVGLAALVLVAAGLWYSRVLLPTQVAEQQVAVKVSTSANEKSETEPSVQKKPQAQTALPPVVAVPRPWLLPPEEALAQLWSLGSGLPVPDPLCDSDGPMSGIACVEAQVRTWGELAELDRPVALHMITPERFGASVLLLAIEQEIGYVFTPDGERGVRLAELAPLWQGQYSFLWHPPEGFATPLSLGDVSPVVARVSALFARLDEQDTALSGEQFNSALKERVVLFQRQYQLEDDGVVGARTLQKLNEKLGIDLTSTRARRILGGAADEFVQR